MEKVVITGIGVTSPIGQTTAEFWKSLEEGRSGISGVSLFDASEFNSRIAGEVKDFDPSGFLSTKESRQMDRFVQFGMVSAHLAVRDSGIMDDKFAPERAGVIVGSGIGGLSTFEKQHSLLLNKGPGRLSPFFIPMLISDMASGRISIRFGLKGPNGCAVTACASASHSIGEAFSCIRHGEADIMLAGGAEAAVTPMAVGGFCAMKALSTRNDSPEKASRPFDLDREGFVIAEGAGVVVLESLSHAKRRGARVYAELAGFGRSGDAYHITAPAPEGEGAGRAMAAALGDARMNPSDIDYINAHGTSTQLNDRCETSAIKDVFGGHAYKLKISSTKSMTGHMLGASGAVELAACVLALEKGIVHPTINYEKPDPECDLNYVANEAVKAEVKTALSNSLGFGGHNASLILKKF